MKKVTIPFDLKIAKDIQEGRVDGRIIDRDGEQYTILKYDAPGKCPLVCICPSPMTNTSKCYNVTPSTPEEIQSITDVLAYRGKRWNPETKQVEDVKREPEPRVQAVRSVTGER